MRFVPAFIAFALAGCATTAAPNDPQQAFWQRLSSLCGQSLTGRLVTSGPQDADLAGQPMTARVGPCTADEVRINFTVGTDPSRNWVVSRLPSGLRLKHVHLHADGHEDELSRYGGDTTTAGSARRQEFPADAFSKALFTRRDIPQSNANAWALEVEAGTFLAYELRRPGRHFRVEFTPGD